MEHCMCKFCILDFLYAKGEEQIIYKTFYINRQSLLHFVAAHVPCSQTLLSPIFILKSELFLQFTYPVLCHHFKWMKATCG